RPRVQIMRGKELPPRLRRRYIPDQRMPDKTHRHARISKKILLKRKNTKRQCKPPLDATHPPRPPCPELQATVIDVSNAQRIQLAGQAQVKSRKVRDNRQH